MADFQRQITSALEASQEDLVNFIQTLVQCPSLANDEGPVQDIIQDKLKSLGLDTEKIIVKFDKLKDHPAFCDDGFSPDSRVNILGRLGHWTSVWMKLTRPSWDASNADVICR